MFTKLTGSFFFFSSLIFSIFLINDTIGFMFAGINMFWVRLSVILAVRVKMTLRRAQKIFMLENIKLC